MAATDGVKNEIAQQQSLETMILGMGNPLLDKQICTPDDHLHVKYGLSLNGAELVNPENKQKLLPLFDEIEDQGESVNYIPGGSAQNTMRIFQWIVQTMGGPSHKAAAYFGAVGDDKNSDLLGQLADQAGLDVHYQRVPKKKTGVCAVLVHGTKRSLVAYLGAAEMFTIAHLDHPDTKRIIHNAKNYYVEGYFLTVCPDAIMHVAKHAAESDKPFTMNLSAEYICFGFLERLNAVLPYIDFFFGNEQEARAYAKANGYADTEDLPKIALQIADIEKVNHKRKRTVIVTQGPLPVLVAYDGQVYVFPVQPIKEEEIKDTNGAGDAFCGGFLAAMASNKPLEFCVRAGNFAARTVIQHLGCTFPDNCTFNEKC